MGPETITGLAQQKFLDVTKNKKLILLYPWTSYRTAFLSYIINSHEENLLYYRLTDNDNSLEACLTNMLEFFSEKVDQFGGYLSEALKNDEPASWGYALADELKAQMGTNGEIFLFIDECDRVPQDDRLTSMVQSLMDQMPKGARLVTSSRLLKYKPWYDYVVSGDAVVLGTERREGDLMYTIQETDRPALEVRALGRGYALVNGQAITNWDGALPRNLFFYFIDNPLVTRDQIFKVFWPKLPTKEATNVFHVTKRKITERITMKVDDREGNFELTQYNSGFYMPSEKVHRYYDVYEFQIAAENAMVSLDDDEEEMLLQRAIDIYKGPFLQEGTMPWMIERRDHLRQLYSQTLIGMGRLRKRQQDEEAALGYYIRAIKETPEREDIHREVMNLYLNRGMIADAAAQYEKLTEILQRDLGINPSRESRELHEFIQAKR